MPIQLTDVIPWFSASAFQAGFLVTLWWWVLGLGCGWLFDVLRKS
jgi:hypothetical protein